MSIIHSPTLSSSTPLQEQFVIPDYIGKRVDPTYSKTLQTKVKEILRSQHNSFPGSQPISFELKHLNVLEREDYFVCEKSDGIRCLLFFVHSPKGPATFMLDRNQIWFYVPNLVFPVRGRETEYLKDTLMDGELVLDKDEQKKTWRFLIFDLMAINGTPIIQRSFNTRLGMLQQDVIQPLKTSLRHISDPSKIPPFKVELKKMERAYGLHLVFDMMTKLGHNSDGIIWTPVKCPYVPGICDKLLKWKPPEMTTADFRINAKWSKEHKPIYYLEVLSHVTYKFYDHFQPEPDVATKWKEHLPDGRIAEFRYDPDWKVTIVEQGYAPMTRKGGWRFVRFRDDKDAANDEIDVKKIKNSILDGVSKEQLLAHMDYIRAAWKAREKGLPQPPLKDLKIRGSLTLANVPSSVSTPSLTTPTAISPVLPSPAFNQNTSNYFSHDHSKSRQNSIDYNPTDRRSSMAELATETNNNKHEDDDDIQENDIELKIAKSLPGSRRQSTAQSSKRDGNLQNEEGMERKRHKSLTELESSHQEINAKLENMPKENTTNVETVKLEQSDPAEPSINNKKQPYLESPVSEHTHKQLSPIPENLPLEKNSLRRKVSNLENDELSKSGIQSMEQESAKERKVRKVQDSQTKEIPPRLKYKNEINQEIQKINEQSKIISPQLDSSPTYVIANSIDQVKHSNYIKQGNDNKIHNYYNYDQSPSVSTNYSIKSEYNAVSSDSYIDNRNNQEKKYDPARSPSNPSIPISTFTNDQISNTAVNTPKNEHNTPSKSKPQNSNIHQLLTSTMEPVSPSQKQTDQPALKVTKSTSHKSFKLSTLLHDDKKVEPSYEENQNEQQRSQAEKHHPTPSSQPSHTPPVQFINFRAEQPHSQGTPTSKQKTIFIQGEYYNNMPTSPNKNKNETNTVYYQHQQHQQQQLQSQQSVRRSNSNTPSSQSIMTERHINNRLSQGSVHDSPISSPLSSPKDSRHGHQITVWKADVGVNSPNSRQQQVQKQHQPPSSSLSQQQQQWQSQNRSEYNYNQNYNASHSAYEMPPHTYYPPASSLYATSSQPPPPPPSSLHHPHSNSRSHPHYEHQQSYVNQSRSNYNGYENHYPQQQQSPNQSYQATQSNQPINEYHIDHRSSYNSHQQHLSYHDQHHPSSITSSSTPKHPERKSGKSKLDFILN